MVEDLLNVRFTFIKGWIADISTSSCTLTRYHLFLCVALFRLFDLYWENIFLVQKEKILIEIKLIEDGMHQSTCWPDWYHKLVWPAWKKTEKLLSYFVSDSDKVAEGNF